MYTVSHAKQKASKWAPFVFIVSNFFSSPLLATSCETRQFHETARVAHVYDGDTIKLSDGRKIRLIGINTPERGRKGQKNEPLYIKAKQHLQNIIRNNNNQVKILFGEDRQDRYKRFLAHIFTHENKNISAMLIEKGMGFAIAIPPNIQFLKCYLQAEQEARKNKQGIWDEPFFNSIGMPSLSKSTRGFHRIHGTVERIGESRTSYWLNLKTHSDSTFALRILKKNLTYFTTYHPKELLNQQLTARGWIYEVKGEQRITIHHPASLKIHKSD